MDPIVFNYIRLGLIYYIFLVCSVCIHEWAHAFVAAKLGDPLPRHQGRVTLNPLAHIDPLGTVLFPLLMIFWPMIFAGGASQLALIGWGKPVQISLPNRATRVRDDMLITAAGPFANLALCLIFAILGGVFGKMDPGLLKLFHWGILINAGLFIFNLIPIPPLDGAHFLKNAVKMSEEAFIQFSRWGFILLLVLINIGPFQSILWHSIARVAGTFELLMDRMLSIS